MKKILFFLPLAVALFFHGFVIFGLGALIASDGLSLILFYVCLITSGVLLSNGKAWGGVFAMLAGSLFVYGGIEALISWSHLAKYGRHDLVTGITIFVYYLVCSLIVLNNYKEQYKMKKTILIALTITFVLGVIWFNMQHMGMLRISTRWLF